MRLLTHTVTPQEAGLPVRTLLRRQLRISGSFLAKLKWRPGAITLNGIPVIVSARTEAGDVLAADVSDLPVLPGKTGTTIDAALQAAVFPAWRSLWVKKQLYSRRGL